MPQPPGASRTPKHTTQLEGLQIQSEQKHSVPTEGALQRQSGFELVWQRHCAVLARSSQLKIHTETHVARSTLREGGFQGGINGVAAVPLQGHTSRLTPTETAETCANKQGSQILTQTKQQTEAKLENAFIIARHTSSACVNPSLGLVHMTPRCINYCCLPSLLTEHTHVDNTDRQR
jgi:hypothetical protein